MTRKSHNGTIQIDQAGVQKIAVYPKETTGTKSGFKFNGLELTPIQ